MLRNSIAFLAGISLFCCCTVRKPSPPQPIEPYPSPFATGGTSATGGTAATGGAPEGSAGETSTPIERDDRAKIDEIMCGERLSAPRKAAMAEDFRKLLTPWRQPRQATAVKIEVRRAEGTRNRLWDSLIPTLTQRIGSCTGNAALALRASEPFDWRGSTHPVELEDFAENVYSEATKRDPWPGSWPPDDTGSNGVSALGVLRDAGFVESWIPVLTFEGVQRALQQGPCQVGSAWLTSMFAPECDGRLKVSGKIEGGHEWKLTGIDVDSGEFVGLNSWGDSFGGQYRGHGGMFRVSYSDFAHLMSLGVEIECLIQATWPI